MAQRYDSISKFIILEYRDAIAKLIFGSQDVEVEETLPTEQINIRHGDVIFRVKHRDGRRAILHIEVQTHDSQEPMETRMASYNGSLIGKHKLPVYGCVIYLHPNAGKTDPGYYAYEWDGGQYLMRYKVIRLIEIDGQAILRAQDPGLLTLTPLMQRSVRMDADDWLGAWVEATKSADVAPEVLPNLLGILSVFSSLVYSNEQIRQHIPEDIMHEFPLVQHYIEQGREEGERKETVESILTLLGARFHPDAVQLLRPPLESIDDLPRLKELLLAAPYVENFEEFAQTLHE